MSSSSSSSNEWLIIPSRLLHVILYQCPSPPFLIISSSTLLPRKVRPSSARHPKLNNKWHYASYHLFMMDDLWTDHGQLDMKSHAPSALFHILHLLSLLSHHSRKERPFPCSLFCFFPFSNYYKAYIWIATFFPFPVAAGPSKPLRKFPKRERQMLIIFVCTIFMMWPVKCGFFSSSFVLFILS